MSSTDCADFFIREIRGFPAQMIYEARTEAGLTQAALAKLVGTSQSLICRLEDADYQGHSLTLLRRIAKSLGKRVAIRLVPQAA